MNTFNEYQEFTKSIANYNEEAVLAAGGDRVHMPWLYPALALSEESGEVNGKIAKFVRKSKTMTYAEMLDAEHQLRLDVGKELGDLLYQVCETARQFDYNFQDIVDINYAKLKDRVARGVLIGEGDSR